MQGQSPKAVNAGPKPDARLKPNAVNAEPKPDAGPKPKSSCLLVVDFLQWEKETMKEHELFRISMQECREANWPGRRRTSTPRDMHRVRRVHVHRRSGDVLARCRRMRSVELVDVRAQSRGDMLGCSDGWVAEMNGLWSQHVSP
ncbi:hypothetical protein CDL15_Pgr011919 [Punica granatum]|uniref:Uncharacterized protein n=1 Tax=Punica granatum TaxID=22663 RepID=A0A218WD57_PUNGR|nr:hypothetical protein CDL15_Pgr011919 [Punica granatum]